MPPYAFLLERELEPERFAANLVALQRVGVPYTEEMVENAAFDMRNQADPMGDWAAVQERYPKAVVGDFDGDPERLTEMDALVAYLQILGRMVDFTTVDPDALRQH